MPLLIVAPALLLFLAQLFFPQHTFFQLLPFPATAYALMALVASMAVLMRQWDWLYWTALLCSHYWVIQAGLQQPVTAADTAALYFFLPIIISVLISLLVFIPKPALPTLAGVTWLLLILLLPVSLLYLPLSDWLIAINMPAVLLMQPFQSSHISWAVLWWITLSGSLWLAVISFIEIKTTHWGQFSCWLSMMAFYFFIQHTDISGWVTVTAATCLLLTLAVQMLHLAYIDELTQLPQRRALMAHLKRLRKRSAVTMLDVDHFKKFNDTWGHDTGDQVLRLLGSILATEKGFTAYRYGGEEFTLVFNHNKEDLLKQVLERVRERVASYPLSIRQPDRPKSSNQGKQNRNNSSGDKTKTVQVTISLGCAIRQGSESADAILKRADQALYAAKKAGRNTVIIAKN